MSPISPDVPSIVAATIAPDPLIIDAVKFEAQVRMTMWQRIKRSVTMWWAAALGIAGTLLAMLPALGDVAGAPGVRDAVQAILPVHMVPYYVLGISLLTALARMRSI